MSLLSATNSLRPRDVNEHHGENRHWLKETALHVISLLRTINSLTPCSVFGHHGENKHWLKKCFDASHVNTSID